MEPDNLENITKDSVPPVRIKDAESARSILSECIGADSMSSYRRSQIQGIIDGNPPYSDEELRDAGQSETMNVNWGHCEAKVDNATLPYFNLLTSVPTYATVRTAYGKRAADREKWSRIQTEEFHRLLSGKNRSSFLKRHQITQKQMVIHGTGLLYFPDARDWRARSISPWNLVLPRGASVDWNDWEFCFVLDEYYCEQLWKYARDPVIARRHGWRVANVRDSIINAQVDAQDQRRPWEWYEREIKNNGLYYSYAKSKVIKIAHLFYKEFDGRITHSIFDRLNPNGWLCQRVGRYKQFSEAFSMFMLDVGNGCYHGVRGLGQKVYKYGEAMNRVNNALLEGVVIGSAVMLQPGTANDVSKLETLSIGPWRILPPGLNFTQVSTSSNLQAAMQVAGYFQGQEGGQISSYVPSMSDSGSRYKSKEEVKIEIGEQSRLTTARADLYLNDLDTHYAEVYRRASNPNLVEEDPGGRDALEFQARCLARGVPRAALVKVESVSAYRSLGMGSQSAQLQTTQQLLALLPMMPENKRTAVLNAHIAALAGQSGLEIFGIEDQEQMTGADASIASLENNAFMSGGQVVIDPNQNHYTHAVIHLKFFGEIVRALQEGKFDPRQAATILQSGGPHLLIHLKFLQQDPTRKQQFDQLNRETADLMKIADQVVKMAQRISEQEAQQQAQPQQQMTPEWAVAQNTMRLANEKAANDIANKNKKAEQTLRIKDVTTAQKVQAGQVLTTQKVVQNAETE